MLIAALALACIAPSPPGGVGPSLVLGTQTFSPGYRFTREDGLVETARGILAMGSDILKITLANDYKRQYPGIADRPDLRTVRELAEKHPSYRKVLAMPFRHIMLWVYPMRAGWWDKGLSAEDAGRTYHEMYDLAAYLLRQFSGSDKTFLLGHWEGDWHLHPDYDPTKDPSDVMIRGMTDWLRVRQRAVEDARRDTPHRRVRIFHYTEVNLVQKAMRGGRTITNDILPTVNPDFVSYSSYDSLIGEGETLRNNLRRALDYIESKLPPRPEIAGRRVFIGEFGFPAAGHPPDRQARLARNVFQVALEWGCPYALYWQYHCNEVDRDGRRRGFWLVDDKGVKQPVYHLLAGYLREARKLERRLRRQQGNAFTADAFRREALRVLPAAPAAP
ncbi:MAG TPA: hypothetical protein VLH79_16380 [Chthonomonadales bacterium]|nr:hypothetical protein [Chthonomonadales bacterium]